MKDWYLWEHEDDQEDEGGVRLGKIELNMVGQKV